MDSFHTHLLLSKEKMLVDILQKYGFIVEAYHRMNSFEALQDYKEHEELYLLLKALTAMHNPYYHEDPLWSYKKILDTMLDYEKYDGECRIVFWFDN